jgi:hypothetical protein
MLELYQELTGEAPTSQLETISGEDFYGVGYEDSSRLPPDVAKLEQLGWRPRHDVRSTFRDAMAYYLNRDSRTGRPQQGGHPQRADVRRLREAAPVTGANGPGEAGRHDWTA